MTKEPWVRRSDETNPAWEAFVAYRDMGLGRSLVKLRLSIGKSERLFEGWSTRHEWQSRVAAWDSYLDEQARQEHADHVRDMARRHGDVARMMLERVAVRLESMDPAELTPRQVREWAEAAVRMERTTPDSVVISGQPAQTPDAVAGLVDMTNPVDVDLIVELSRWLRAKRG